MQNINEHINQQKYHINEATGDWWSFFGTKEVLTVATVIGGLASLIKALNNTIKARFRKCAKLLYTMQKDFGTAENGMNMSAVMPGVGSKLTDFITKIFGINSGKNSNSGALGLRPFVNNYISEISRDYSDAVKSFNTIHDAGEYIGNTAESIENAYSSFADALKNITLNENYNALHEAISFANGMFTITDANGENKNVQVNKQSTREICYSIISMFCGKYFNMNTVSQKLGIDMNSLSDLNASNVDRFKKVCQAMKEPVGQSGNKMYTRVETNYNKMIESYIRIANNIVNNFDKYTTQLVKDKSKNKGGISEKDSNLLFTAKEKLMSEVNRQEDIYKNNFYRVLNAIISSPEYTSYIDFIIENVMPVFASGNAGDADAVLDTLPRVNDYFVISQQGGGDTVVLARILNVDNANADNPDITFARVGQFKNIELLRNTLTGEGASRSYNLQNYPADQIDKSVYAKERGGTADQTGNGGDRVKLEYNKWIALNPIIATNVPVDERDESDLTRTKIYMNTAKGADGQNYDVYLFGISDKVKESYSSNFVNNISEADETNPANDAVIPGNSSEIPVDDPQSDIIRIAVAAIVSGTKLSDSPQRNKITCGYINLTNKCSAKQLDEKLKSMGFKSTNNLISEKTAIETAISSGKYLNPTADTKLENVTAIDAGIKTITTRKTSDILKETANIKINNIINLLNKVKPDVLTAPMSITSNNNTISFFTTENAKAQPNFIDTGIQNPDSPDDTLKLYVYFALMDKSGNLISADQSGQSQTNTSESFITEDTDTDIDTAIDTNTETSTASDENTSGENQNNGDNKDNEANVTQNNTVGVVITVNIENNPPVVYAPNNKGAIRTAYINMVDLMVNQKLIESISTYVESPIFDIKYGTFNINESRTNMINIERTITPSQNGYYFVLSENAWGDGSILNPVKYLENSMLEMLTENQTYDAFAKIAKNSRTINFMKLTESSNYNTELPLNKYQLLSRANPLYESTAIIKFNKNGNISTVYNLGAKRISK